MTYLSKCIYYTLTRHFICFQRPQASSIFYSFKCVACWFITSKSMQWAESSNSSFHCFLFHERTGLMLALLVIFCEKKKMEDSEDSSETL